MIHKIAGPAAYAFALFLRALVGVLSDRSLGRIFRGLERLVYALTGEAAVAVAEIADIFESGPPHSDRARKIVKNLEPDLIASAVKCLARPSPYGAE